MQQPQGHSIVCGVHTQAVCSAAGGATSSQSASKFTINLYTCVPTRQIPFSNPIQLNSDRVSRSLVCAIPREGSQIRKEASEGVRAPVACTSSSYRRTPPTPSGPCISMTQFMRGVQHSRHAPCGRQLFFQQCSGACVSYLRDLRALWRGRLACPDKAHLRWIRVPVSELTLHPSEVITSQDVSGQGMHSDHARKS